MGGCLWGKVNGNLLLTDGFDIDGVLLASQITFLQSICVESVFVSACGAFVFNQIRKRQHGQFEAFELDSVTLLICLIEFNARDCGNNVNSAGRYTDLKDNAVFDKGRLVKLLNRGPNKVSER